MDQVKGQVARWFGAGTTNTNDVFVPDEEQVPVCKFVYRNSKEILGYDAYEDDDIFKGTNKEGQLLEKRKDIVVIDNEHFGSRAIAAAKQLVSPKKTAKEDTDEKRADTSKAATLAGRVALYPEERHQKPSTEKSKSVFAYFKDMLSSIGSYFEKNNATFADLKNMAALVV